MMNGILGTRADMMMDLVIIAFTFILPALLYSWSLVRNENYQQHKICQLSLAIILAIAVTLFEVNLKLSGGIFELTKESAYNGSSILNFIIYSHTIVAILTTIIWFFLVIISLKKFDKQAKPNSFSKTHRRFGRLGMIGMILTGLSSYPLYILGFVY